MVLALCVAFFAQLPLHVQTYETALGEQREIELADGSHLILNTASEAEIRFDRKVRLVRLRQGQASFSVAHNSERPFIVIAAEGAVMAVGTEFDVFTSPDETRVTLIEGAVDVAAGLSERQAVRRLTAKDEGPSPDIAQMTAGEQVVIDVESSSMSSPQTVDLGRLMAWREGKVSFKNTPLKDAIDEMNRYSVIKIRLDDKELADLPISGVFGVRNSDGFTSALEALFNLEARRQGRSLILTRKKDA